MTWIWWLALLAGLVMAHDLSMATVGHPGSHVQDTTRSMADHDTGRGHHHADAAPPPDETVPESCGTVRLAPARQDVPEHRLFTGPILEAVFEPWQTTTRAISVHLLENPVSNSPSACLARFQVFRI